MCVYIYTGWWSWYEGKWDGWRDHHSWDQCGWGWEDPAWKQAQADVKGETRQPERQDSWHETDIARKLSQRQPTKCLETLPEEGLEKKDQAAAIQSKTEQPDAVKAEAKESDGAVAPEAEDWRLDKFGATLTPQALYMRFYRGLRSKRDPPPPEVQAKIMEAEKEKDAGGSKLHTLYEHYLACKGCWRDSVLVISVAKRTRRKADEVYSFIRFDEIVAKYGEALALDLKQRLEEQEKKVEKKTPGKYVRKHPDFPAEESMWLYRCFLSMNEIKEREREHSATLNMEATVDVEDAMEAV